MAFAAADCLVAEDKSAGITLSDGSLQKPHFKKNARFSASFPIIKPYLSAKPPQNVIEVFRHLKRVCYQKQQPYSRQLSNSEMKFKKAKKILSEWSWKLKERKQNSVCLKGECEVTLRSLHKRGEESSIQSESSEDSVSRQWVRSRQRSKNTVGLHIPHQVWDRITKSTADVLLDPNTANPDLLVSENGKQLRAKEYTGLDNWHGYQRKRSKFDGWTCVQAKEGYNKGRHYWAVDVRKKREWRVGVMKESAPRNGYITMNTKTGYWNLRLQLGTLMALTEPVTKLDLPTPSKIGILLDIEEGHVSFYDTEKKIHIYTFNIDFKEAESIYPVFGTVETDRALVISS